MEWFKKHKILTVLGVIVLLIIIGSALGGSGTDTAKGESNNKETSNNKSEPAIAKVGESARDGKFEFVVKGMECGKPSVGANEYLTKTAQGQYCLLTVSVKNIGDEPQSLFADNQYLFNSAGQKYSADGTATSYAAPQGSTWYSEINPGNSVEGVIVFDVPKDVTPAQAQLHDSALSGGIKVNLVQ